jgi:hypothetical protein
MHWWLPILFLLICYVYALVWFHRCSRVEESFPAIIYTPWLGLAWVHLMAHFPLLTKQ